ncbi:MAG TPA: PRC-barrel domain-containing protein [Xanthobacteraceae bacterium]|nr:PRC-barrel domain-containing protein [Xanthobacteraceae bacterium]
MSKTIFYGVGIGTLLFSLAIAAAQGKPAPNDGLRHFRAKDILGSKVSIDNDMSVGTVDDIVLDENGNVDYLIVLSQDKLVSVPWDATRFDTEQRSAVVHISPEQFKQVPRYTADNYPVFSAPTYRTQTYRYYGLTPGQERRLIRRGVINP